MTFADSSAMPLEKRSMDAPLHLWEGRVLADWIDYNGHMSEAFYVLVFGYATDAFMDLIGMDESYRQRTSLSLYTVEAHVRYLSEVSEGESLRVSTQILATDSKRVHLFHHMYGPTDTSLATEEVMLLHVDASGPRTVSFDPKVSDHLEVAIRAHARLATPEQAGSSIGL